MKRHHAALKELIKTHAALPQQILIKHLNARIRGWSNYYSAVCAKRSFTRMDTLLFQLLWRWSKRRHPNKSAKWRATTYWHPEKGKWQFATSGCSLRLHRMTPIKRHVKVQGTKNPFDGNWIYWTKRQGNHPETPPRMAYLLKRQQGKCVRCHPYLKDGDQIEIDHSIPISLGGTDQVVNLQLLHRHCHDQKTATDGSVAARRGFDDSSQIVEKPDEARSLTSGFEAERRG